MAFPTLLLLSSFLWANLTLAQNGVKFLYPTKDLTFYYLDTVNVTWTSHFPNPQLYTFCRNPSGTAITENVNSSVPTNGSALVVLSYKNVTPCWFDLRPSKDAGNGANSPNFTLVSTQRSQTTIGLSSSSSSSTESSSASSTSTAKPKSSGHGPGGGLSGGAKAGIGIGVSLVAVAALLGAGAFLLRRKRKRRSGAAGSGAGPGPGPGPGNAAGGASASNGAYVGIETKEPDQPKADSEQNQNRSELPGDWRGHELDTSTQMHELPERP